MSPKPIRRSVGEKVRYRFDNTISRGTLPVIGYLTLITFAFVLFAALILAITGTNVTGNKDTGFAEEFWQSLLRILDPGTFSGDNGWFLRIVMLIVTIIGITIAAVLIGLIASGIEQRIDMLRRGKSAVLESNHTLILGFSPRIYTVISEICVANENQRRPSIVVLANREKQEIEEDLASRIQDTLGTRVVCRSGEPANLQDVVRGNAAEARSIIVLGGDENEADAEVVKTVLAALHVIGTRDVPVVAELNDPETARALEEACGKRVLTVRAADVIARITAQACRQAGLSAVCQELLDFDGDEIYFQPAPELVGHTFGDSLLAYDTSSVIGLRHPDGTVEVNPPMNTTLVEGDAVIAVSEDDGTVVFSGIRDIDVPASQSDGHKKPEPEQLLVVGWNPLGPVILTELDQFVPQGSSADILVDPDLVDPDEIERPELRRLTKVHFEAERADLDELTQHLAGRSFDHVIILGYRNGITPAAADARTLLTLLLLRRVLTGDPEGRLNRIVTELLDSSDVELARATGADDFVVSDALSSYMIAQLSENPELQAVFTDLFDAVGSAITLKPVSLYASPWKEVRYDEVVAAARARGEVALGYCRSVGYDVPHDVIVNPPKSDRMQFTQEDRVVVIGPPG